MTMKQFKEVMVLIAVLMWIPLAIVAFFLSPVRVDIKLAIGAAASFILMFVIFLKES